jgi:hypothetical protein
MLSTPSTCMKLGRTEYSTCPRSGDVGWLPGRHDVRTDPHRVDEPETREQGSAAPQDEGVRAGRVTQEGERPAVGAGVGSQA